MKFFFPDSQDTIDPSFDFEKETRSDSRIRQRDDLYAHEVFEKPPYDGILVSRAIVEGVGSNGRYTFSQKQRLLRCGLREFFRLPSELKSIGDCGAFSYVREKYPPVTVSQVVDFYDACGVDYGVSIDHIILGFDPTLDKTIPGLDPVSLEWRNRQDITIKLAEDFFKEHKKRKSGFTPIGVVQGWSPNSYAHCFNQIQKIGFKYIGLGGLVPLKTMEILAILDAIEPIRKKDVEIHLFGVNRLDHFQEFSDFGVRSFDSTSPLMKAFKDEKENYFLGKDSYTAIRIPQVQSNLKLSKKIASGELKQEVVRSLESECLIRIQEYGKTSKGLKSLLKSLQEYELVHDPKKNHIKNYERTLSDRPWEKCKCSICKKIGIHVVIFRGAERNRRRGFHNVFNVFNNLIKKRSA
jgi:hypothetical protein